MNIFGWGVDGFGRKHICWNDQRISRYVIFCPISDEYLFDCIELLEKQLTA